MSKVLTSEERIDPATGSRTIAIGRAVTFTCDCCGRTATLPTPCPDGPEGWHKPPYDPARAYAEQFDYCPGCPGGGR